MVEIDRNREHRLGVEVNEGLTVPEFTPIQGRILALLADGLPHTRKELEEAMQNSSPEALGMHLCFLRKKLRKKGMTIVSEHAGRRMGWRQVRFLRPDDGG